ncbi:rhomboid family intramembrane serine protease [Aliishimia ponticola]|uniref:Rhomboid family intramembrane serine protease n=1 Tax=Aliishimia ponticola TaxID=2499833 RepID=A0A4S4NB87_9RHOB|nr:rhomboid family intramembrane serine protease [Aliishimia ponticola]THH36579.1 rhomboid family intramembrane serine protease [Aliishimia ponticola]
MDDGKTGYDPNPVNPLPPVVLVMFLALFGVEAVLAAGEAGWVGGPQAVGWRLALIEQFGFSPQHFDWMIENRQYPGDILLRFVTYPFLHLGFLHMAIASVIFLAMGKLVGEVISHFAVPAIFFAASILGALVYGGLLDEQVWLVGAYPGAYGLIGGFTFILWTRARATGANQMQAFSLIAMLMGIQLVFGALFGADRTWVAELTGFIAGFAMCFVLVPGARAALLARMRQR